MSRVSSGEARQTVSFRVSPSQLELLDEFSQLYQQPRGDLFREAIQMWLSQQIGKRGIPPKNVKAADTDAVL